MRTESVRWLARRAPGFVFSVAVVGCSVSLSAQDRLKLMPGYERYHKMAQLIQQAVGDASVRSVKWNDAGFEYEVGGKKFRYDFASKRATEIPKEQAQPQRYGGFPERGRQYTETKSP